ncbi:MAG: ATPase domain-containing protein [Archaeoglobaceae archaeon]
MTITGNEVHNDKYKQIDAPSKEVTDRIIDYIEKIEDYGFGFTKELLFHGIKTEAKEQLKKGVDKDKAWINAFEMAREVCENIIKKIEARSFELAESFLLSRGYRNIVRDGETVGRSGTKHTFSLFAVNDEGKDAAIDVIPEGKEVDTDQVKKLYKKKNDLELGYLVISLSPLSEDAKKFAEKEGLEIFDRQVVDKLVERRKYLISSGIPVLDRVMGGGLIKDRVYLLSGEMGSGKTTFGLRFLLEGCGQGEKSLLILTDQNPEHLIQDFEMLDYDLRDYIDRELLYLYDLTHQVEELKEKVFHGDISPIEYCERILNDLYSHIRKVGAKRVVIDTFTTLLILNHPWARDIARKMIVNSENLDSTIVLIKDKYSEKSGLEESFVQAVIELTFQEDETGIHKYLTVTKARGIHSLDTPKSCRI